MVGTWLYTADGRAVCYVAVQLPMPMFVTHNGRTYTWDATERKYLETTIYMARNPDDHPDLKEATMEHLPK